MSVVKAEGDSITKPLYETIMEESTGRPRDALQMLEQVLSTPEDQRDKVITQIKAFDGQVKDLCQALLRQGVGWKEVRYILKQLENEDEERIRRAVLGYMKAVLLNSDNMRAGLVMEEFVHPFYDTGYPGLVYTCYRIVKS
jgi:DNA polymerase III gamma/tau subunit